MKTRRTLIQIWLLCAAMLLPAVVQAQFNYTDNGDGTCTITKYTGYNGSVIIPSMINGLTNTSIGNNSFSYNTSVTSVAIPDSVTSIGAMAFYSCQYLASVTIGSNVTSIGSMAFYQCYGLASVTLPASVSSLADMAFYDCTGCIGFYFLGNAPSIGSSVFGDDNYGAVYYLAGTTNWGTTYGGISAKQIQYTYAITNSTVTLTKYIGSGGDVTIPDIINGFPVTSIGNNAFCNSNNLTSVTMTNNVTSIGGGAFYGCTTLINVTLGQSLGSIGDAAFYGCTNLTNVFFQGNAPSVGLNIFGGDTNATVFYLAGTKIWAGTFCGLPTVQVQFTSMINNGSITITGYLGSGGKVTIPDRIGLPVTSIGDMAFYDSTNLISLIISDSVTNIGASAFDSCSKLASVTFSTNVTSIGSGAFARCGLTSVMIPNGVTSIAAGLFIECPNLTNVTIPNSVTNIGNGAFCFCDRLFSITIPASVTKIVSQAFQYCLNLTNVYFLGNAPGVDLDDVIGDNNATAYYLQGKIGWGATFGGLLPPNGFGIPAVLWNPQVQTYSASFGVKTNRFGFNITGSSNLVIVVEACTNLANPVWQQVQTNILTGGTSYFNDPQWTNYPGRFYRFRSP